MATPLSLRRLSVLTVLVLAAASTSSDAQNFMRKKDKPEDDRPNERTFSVTVEVDQAAPPVLSAYDVRILRDEWGVPHIFGKTDVDTAYGLAWAHCEDDFGTTIETLLMGRARGAEVNGPDAAPIDFMVHLLGVWDDVNAKYETDLSPEVRAICEAYAQGINDYAALHPDEIPLDDLFPATGKDIVMGFAFRSPFFYGLDSAVLELFGDERKRDVSEKQASLDFDDATAIARAGEKLRRGAHLGSNTFAVAPHRTIDGGTYLNVNSHQPWEGPVAWWEAHVRSEEGWDMVGGTFPGSPLILHGHNRNLGWAHTVNRPDLVDIYVLTINPDNENQYWFDGEWRELESEEIKLRVRINPDSPMTMPVNREVLRSVHGPVLRQSHGTYAVRYAGMGEIRAVEQWFRMNKAKTMEDWLDAMRMRAVSSMNSGYADREGNILYLYNANAPIRAEGYDWSQYLPGDTSETLWTEMIPFDDLPLVINPPSGFVQNCNASPFTATDGEGNFSPSDFPESMGFETHQTNRSMRALELFGNDPVIEYSEFYEYKYDMMYSTESDMAKRRDSLLAADPPSDALTLEALEVLRNWDLGTNPENRGAALGVMTFFIRNATEDDLKPSNLFERLGKTAQALKDVHGRIDPEWREVNRIIRGDTNIGTGGGPDILHAVYGRPTENGAHLRGVAGDSYILLAVWDKDGNVNSRSIHQYGAATLDEDSPHYDDQAPLFAERKLKTVWLDEADIRKHLDREYRPGEVAATLTD